MAEHPHQANFFEQMGDRQIVSATRAKHRAAEKRRAKLYRSDRDAPLVSNTAQDKKLRDQERQLRIWRRDRRRRIREAMEAAEHPGWKELSRILRQLTLERPQELVDYIRAATWLHQAAEAERYLVLSIIGTSIARLRERNGYEPFDDSLPGEDPTVFEIVRNLILGRSPAPA